MSEGMITVPEKDLKKLVIDRLVEAGMSQNDALVVADVLVFADLRGVKSHGVLRVEHYTNRIQSGGMNLKAKPAVRKLKAGIGIVDAQGGAGHPAMKLATAAAIDIARDQGMAIVGVKNNSHCGALAYYVQQALDAKMAALVCVNTDSAVVPTGGKFAFLGTNPFAFGYPARRESILLDMATSEVAFGKIFYAQERNVPIPDTWAVDAEGNKCTDPNKAKALHPFGGAKGYGINVMVEALTGLLIGGVFGPHVKKMYAGLDTYRDLASFVLVIDPRSFWSSEEYLDIAQAMIDELHAQAAGPGSQGVLIPGEIETNNVKRSLAEGISIPKSVHDFLTTPRSKE
ncbi:MAG TPA: Ldh family oxidoreductase [Spirochaetia bacterium]|nr:Ldh family oxidoreductase [Spirochaetia bacterium]